MTCPGRARILLCGAAFGLFGWMRAGVPAVAAQPDGGVQELLADLAPARSAGCGGQPGTATRLKPEPRLNEAAWRIAQGASAQEAMKAAGYRAQRVFTASMSGQRSIRDVAELMVQRYCKPLSDPQLSELGFHRQGASTWLVLATPFNPPPEEASASVGARVLALVNETRSQARHCGDTQFDAAPPLKANGLLERAAALHAQDMARYGYLEHEGRDGSSPADRVTRVGYRWRATGENIASGQTSAEQVVQEWTRSPVHCANLMHAEFTEMGVAYALSPNSPGGIYWAQELATPR